ncbi:DUF6944 family repetitive protein [Bacillus sp. NRRL B-14911]|uniref:DUF6944 family repetitive protein n=1 Tax=Bacillus sp. NRRL B-14911 TaxID=313627 RepID=UPI003FA481B7
MGTSEWLVLDDSAAEALIIIGNELQAAGSALEADGQDRPSLEKIGNELQAAGQFIRNCRTSLRSRRRKRVKAGHYRKSDSGTRISYCAWGRTE